MNKRVLVAPLDWGLGHATRCVPIIRTLLDFDCTVLLAGAGHSLALLKVEFPELTSFDLPAYQPVYPAKGSMMVKLLLQTGRFKRVVKKEQKVVTDIVVQHKIDLVISDNRYGCYSGAVPCIFISHQLRLIVPPVWIGLGLIANRVIRSYIQKFSMCWVPDFPGAALTGKLSATADKSVKYIGPLSRFGFPEEVPEKKYEVLALISGPEPQRSIFEEMVTTQLVDSGIKALVVRGVVDHQRRMISEKVESVDHLDSAALERAILQSEVVLARSGYSTIMDLARLQKRVIFVPTPGQTEQEYLANRFEQLRISFSVNQKSFSLLQALEACRHYTGFKNYTFDDKLLIGRLKESLSLRNAHPQSSP
jgi:uncharacterized protein (TIGR00661 family)